MKETFIHSLRQVKTQNSYLHQRLNQSEEDMLGNKMNDRVTPQIRLTRELNWNGMGDPIKSVNSNLIRMDLFSAS